MFKASCREKIAPDRSKLFAQAKQKADQASAEIKRTNRTGTIWDYFLVMNGDLDNSGSYYAEVSPSGSQYIEVYDENGEKVGIYDSFNGFKVKNTERENACISILGKEYRKAYNEYRKEIENSQKYKSIDQKFETKA